MTDAEYDQLAELVEKIHAGQERVIQSHHCVLSAVKILGVELRNAAIAVEALGMYESDFAGRLLRAIEERDA